MEMIFDTYGVNSPRKVEQSMSSTYTASPQHRLHHRTTGYRRRAP